MEMNHKANGVRNQSGICSKLALAGILGPIIFWLVSFFLPFFQPGYSSIRHTLSALVLSSHGWIQTLDFCILGLLVMLFAVGLYSGIEKRCGLKPGVCLLFLMGVGLLIIGIFPTDLAGGSISLQGKIHVQTVRVIGLLFPIACFLLIPSLKSDLRWRGFAVYTGVTGIVFFILIIGWIVGMSSGWLSSWVGLYERIFMATGVIWLEVIAIRLFFLPSYPDQTVREIGHFLDVGLKPDFWRYLGESGRVIYSKINNQQPSAPVNKTKVVQASKYMAFGTLLLMVLAHGSREKRVFKQSFLASQSPVVNATVSWGIKNLGKHLGLSPVTNLIFTVVKDKEQVK